MVDAGAFALPLEVEMHRRACVAERAAEVEAKLEEELDPTLSDWNSDVSCLVDLVADMMVSNVLYVCMCVGR